MNKLTIIIPYYNNLEALSFQVSNIFPVYRKLGINVILIDDCSTEPITHTKCENPLYKVIRVKQDIPWNQPACRNLGMMHSETDWNILTDIDHWVPECSLRKFVDGDGLWYDTNYNTRMFKFVGDRIDSIGNKFKPHKNTFLVCHPVWDILGGYDLDFCGNYGYDDSMFFYRIGCDRSIRDRFNYKNALYDFDWIIMHNPKWSKGGKHIDRTVNKALYERKKKEINAGTYKPNLDINFEYEVL